MGHLPRRVRAAMARLVIRATRRRFTTGGERVVEERAQGPRSRAEAGARRRRIRPGGRMAKGVDAEGRGRDGGRGRGGGAWMVAGRHSDARRAEWASGGGQGRVLKLDGH